MKIKSISFENYKAFFKKQKMALRPITVLIGKNSSGKSSIAKLFTLLENSLSGFSDEPLLLKNNNVELGGEFENLFFGNKIAGIPLKFSVEYENTTLSVALFTKEETYGMYIQQWHYKDKSHDIDMEKVDEQADVYCDQKTGKKYHCVFKGFRPTYFLDCSTQTDISEQVNIASIDVDYIGPFRILPDRMFHLSGKASFADTGIAGENAYAMLAVSKMDKTPLHKKVGEWYQKYFDGWALKVDDKGPYFQVLLSKNSTDVNIVDVGQGMNQALPLVVRANSGRKDSIIVLEQPELHLHPAAHGDLMELFALSAKENDQTFIIETHSENMLLRLRRLIVEDSVFTKDDVIIYWVEDHEDKGQELREITLDEYGVLSDWPAGVFNENIKELFAIDKALTEKNH